jgi:hypothetical protein
MRLSTQRIAAASMTALAVSAAGADINFTQGDSAPTYATTLNFDEVGGPTGPTSTDAWLASHGVTSLQAGDANSQVLNLSGTPGYGWLPDSNVFVGGFGVFMNFENDLTDFSAQIWDNAGPASGFSGGMLVVALNDGAEVGSLFVDLPVFGLSGDENTWFNVSATDGMVFDEIRVVGFAFVAPQTLIDNISWNAVPAPGSLAVLALGGVACSRRRRA